LPLNKGNSFVHAYLTPHEEVTTALLILPPMAKNEIYYEMLLREEQSYLQDIAGLQAMIETEKTDLESVRNEIQIYKLQASYRIVILNCKNNFLH
jgi:hypothetical protein